MNTHEVISADGLWLHPSTSSVSNNYGLHGSAGRVHCGAEERWWEGGAVLPYISSQLSGVINGSQSP
jgi:hypothetical protein